ncbi:MAG: GNAT family N-acetyltransferase [Candidatus Methanoplasma sp.]|jgi:ribosomal-protein-alanine N-acetyltransferase|nr:GNAT family N-acetyltransferase [Candidatus Methanoplasma sp.]
MLIRQMTARDVDRVYEIACRSLDEYYTKEVFYFLIDGWPSGQLVAVNMIGNIMGFISGARLTRDKTTVSLLAVDDMYRGVGAGSGLLREFGLRTSMDGKQHIQLEVRSTNADVISFYRKRGFVVTEYIKGFYNNGGDAVRMVCSVRANS